MYAFYSKVYWKPTCFLQKMNKIFWPPKGLGSELYTFVFVWHLCNHLHHSKFVCFQLLFSFKDLTGTHYAAKTNRDDDTNEIVLHHLLYKPISIGCFFFRVSSKFIYYQGRCIQHFRDICSTDCHKCKGSITLQR